MRNRIAQFAELRRALPIAAAALVVGALLVPMWRITFSAPQYPTMDMVVELYAYPKLGGDFAEVAALNKYVGFHYPDPVFVDPNYEVHENAIATPEWVLGPVAFLGMAATGVFVALAPTERKLKLGLKSQLVGTLGTLVVMFAVIQYRLHQAGHALDPDAPLRGVDGFTPPVLGSYEVANISGTAWFGPGGYMVALAVALLVGAYLCRDTDATVTDLPALLGRRVGSGDHDPDDRDAPGTRRQDAPGTRRQETPGTRRQDATEVPQREDPAEPDLAGPDQQSGPARSRSGGG